MQGVINGAVALIGAQSHVHRLLAAEECMGAHIECTRYVLPAVHVLWRHRPVRTFSGLRRPH